MKCWMLIAGSIVLVSLSSGCRNGAGFCGNCRNGVTIAPPPTYSLQIPSTARNPAYYNGTANPNALLSPNGSAPTPAGQSGWQSAGNGGFSLGQTPGVSNGMPGVSNGLPGAPNGSLGSAPGMSVVESSTGSQLRINPNQVAAIGSGLQPAGRTPVNYSTTSVDERFDDSRLALNDASQVRAPSPFAPPQGAGRLPQGSLAASGPYGPQYVQGSFVTGSQPRVINGQFQNTSPVGGQTYPYPATTYPVSPAGYGIPPQSPQVIAQSTATHDPRTSPNYQNGWRDRGSVDTLR